MVSVTKIVRMRAAIIMAVLYAMCVLAPSTALAFVADPAAARGQTEVRVIAPSKHEGMSHVHAAGKLHHHHDQSGDPNSPSSTGDKAADAKCCGLFCVFALAQDPTLTLAAPLRANAAVQSIANDLAACGPSRLHRPPIA